MRAKHFNKLFDWYSFGRNQAETVIVLPSPHGEYKSGISYSDALAAGEIYAGFRELGQIDLRTPELLGNDISKNLVLLGGPKANPVAKRYRELKQSSLNFELHDGVIYDRHKQVVLTPEYLSHEAKTNAHLVADYGVIVYSDNPFGNATEVLHVAGIKGFGTFAAAVTLIDRSLIRQAKNSLKSFKTGCDAEGTKRGPVEILVKVAVTDRKARRDSISIEKLCLSGGGADQKWESEAYGLLKPERPQSLYITIGSSPHRTVNIKMRIGDREISVGQSPDRRSILYHLAKQAKDDYVNQRDNNGWLNAVAIADRLWQIKHKNGAIEIPDEMKRQISENIKRWATHLQRRGDLVVSDKIKLDCGYINSEILVFDLDVRKKIVDLVHMINQEQKNGSGPGHQLIESKPRLGYRINVHPALIFINDSCSPQLSSP
jgi:hypothetical protein